MTEPLTPYDCDLRGYPWMPVDCTRLLTSETWMLGTSDEKVAAFTLWAKSWHQVPAGSLPDNDRMLAAFSEASTKWPKVREHALRGWIKCNDGRLYHPVVCEKANESWQSKMAQKARTEAARLAKQQKRQEAQTQPVTTSVTETVATSVTENVTGSTREDKTVQDRIKKERTLPSVGTRAEGATGSRLPDDWQPEESAFAGASPVTLAKFRDYWRAQPGAKGRKTDWQATWRNWCRREAEQPKPKLHTLPPAEQDRRILAAVGLNFDDPQQTVVPMRIAQ